MTSTSTPGPLGTPAPLTLTARSPEDLLALAPVVLGFFPRDSVVMLTFGARAPFHARIDFPEFPDEEAEVIDSLVAPAVQHGVERVVLLLYGTDRSMSARLCRALTSRLRRAGIGVLDAMRVEEERWYPLSRGDERVREHGVPYDISAHPFLVLAVVDGRITHGSREALAATLVTDPAAASLVAGATLALEPPTDLLAEGAWIEATLARALGAGAPPDDGELARLLLALTDLRLRDAAWSSLTRERSREAVAWWTHALTRCPDGLAAAPAALLAWSAWLDGNGALAWCAVDRCEEVEPGYGLARIVADLLERAHPPTSWAESIDWRAALAESTRAG